MKSEHGKSFYPPLFWNGSLFEHHDTEIHWIQNIHLPFLSKCNCTRTTLRDLFSVWHRSQTRNTQSETTEPCHRFKYVY